MSPVLSGYRGHSPIFARTDDGPSSCLKSFLFEIATLSRYETIHAEITVLRVHAGGMLPIHREGGEYHVIFRPHAEEPPVQRLIVTPWSSADGRPGDADRPAVPRLSIY